MERAEAVAVLKKLKDKGLIVLSQISIDKRRNGTVTLVIKAEGDCAPIREFIASTNYTMSEDKAKGTCVIYKP